MDIQQSKLTQFRDIMKRKGYVQVNILFLKRLKNNYMKVGK